MNGNGENEHTGIGDAPTRRRFPLWLIIAATVLVAVIVLLQYSASNLDHAAVNVATLLLVALGGTVALSWFALRSGFHPLICLLVPALSVASMVVFFVYFEIAHVDGELVPTFRRRGAPARDELLGLPDVAQPEAANLNETGPDDFPQFLGPHADAAVDKFTLNLDWNQNPPELLWRQSIGAGWSAFSAVNGFAVTMEQRGEDELVSCYEVETGKLLWFHAVKARHETFLGGTGPRSTPTIHEGRVYALGATGILRCLEGASGQEVWTVDVMKLANTSPDKDIKVVAWGRAASPLLYKDLVILPAGGPPGGPFVSLVALDKSNGELIWQAGNRQVSYSTPKLATLAGVQQVLSLNEDNISSHDPDSGEILWQHPRPGSSDTEANTTQPLVLPDDRVLLTKGYGGGALLFKVTRSQETWSTEMLYEETRLLKTKFTNCAVLGDHVYGLSDGILECVSWQTGQRAWKRGRYRHGQLLRVGNALLVLTESGELVLVEATPEGHVELGSMQALDGKTWNNLCLYGPYLLLRNSREAACYRLAMTAQE